MRSRRSAVPLIVAVGLVIAILVTSACTATSSDGTGTSGSGSGDGSATATDTVGTDGAGGVSDGGAGGTDGGGTTGDPATVEAQRLVEIKCAMCHSLDRVWNVKMTRAGWASTVDRMKRHGLVLTDEEYATIVDHLAATRAE